MLLYVPEGAWKVSADSLQTYDGLMYRISNTTASVLGLEDTLKEVVIPAKVDGRSVISIENCAFDGETSIRKVVIPSSVVALGNHAFRNCTNLSEVEGGESLDNIGFDVMENTAWLKNRQDEVAVLGGKGCTARKPGTDRGEVLYKMRESGKHFSQRKSDGDRQLCVLRMHKAQGDPVPCQYLDDRILCVSGVYCPERCAVWVRFPFADTAFRRI